MFKARQLFNRFVHAELGFGMVSKRDLFKRAFGFEMYLTP